MRSIFLDDNEDLICRVYSPELTERLAALAGLGPRVFSADDVRSGEHDLSDVRFIFSTWGMPELASDEIARLFPALECVFYAAGTVQYFARPFLERGVRVFSAWKANAVPVAEFAASLIMLANKRFFASARHYSAGDRAAAGAALDGWTGNYGAKVGILGAGAIGSLVIGRLGDKLDIRVFDPFLSDERAAELGVTKRSLAEVFAECEVVSCHIADNEKTRGMLRREHFASMPPHGTFINTGRGATLVEADLAEVLAEREDLTAILDVTDPEPVQPGSPFFALPNVILTPHIAGSAGLEVRRMAEYMEAECAAYLAGSTAGNEVTLAMLETMA